MMRRNANPALARLPAPSSTTIRFASLVLVFLTIIALGAVAYFTERESCRSRDWVIHTYQVRSQLNDLQLEVMRARPDETSSLLMRGGRQAQRSQRAVRFGPSGRLRNCVALPKTTPGNNNVLTNWGRS